MQTGQVTKGKRLHGSQPQGVGRGGEKGLIWKAGSPGERGKGGEGNQPAQRKSPSLNEQQYGGGRRARACPSCSILRCKSAPQPAATPAAGSRRTSPGAPRHTRPVPCGAAPSAAFPSAAPGNFGSFGFGVFVVFRFGFFSGGPSPGHGSEPARSPACARQAETCPQGDGGTQLFSRLFFFLILFPPPLFFRGTEGARLQPPAPLPPRGRCAYRRKK